MSKVVCGRDEMTGEEITLTNLPDGEFAGIWTGYEASAVVDEAICNFTTEDGVRGVAEGCVVTINSGIATVRCVPEVDEQRGWVPDRIQRQTMVVSGSCPRCSRPMPDGTVNCKNCGAEMDPLGTEFVIENHGQ